MTRRLRNVVISIILEDGKEYLYQVCRSVKLITMTKAYRESIELLDSNEHVYAVTYKYYELSDKDYHADRLSAETLSDISIMLDNGSLNKALKRYELMNELNLI